MSVLPKNTDQRIQFCEEHIPTWTSAATSIGTTTAAVTDLQTKTEAARAALLSQGEKQEAAKAATADLKLAMSAMNDAVSDIIRQIKTKAAISGSGVYTLAQIPAPAIPAPRPAPGKPYDMKVTLDESGILNLKWKCDNPAGTSGTIYQVFRRIGAAGEFIYVGGTGTKSFVDGSLPAGAAQITYQIQAVRSTAAGPWAQFNVNFGVSASGAPVASVSTPPRLAA